MGVTIMPPNPAYYNHPSSLDDIVNQFVARLLDQINIEVPFAQRWHGMHKTSANIVKMEKVEE